MSWAEGNLERVSVLNLAGETGKLVHGKQVVMLRAKKGLRQNFEWRDEQFKPV